MWYQIRLWNRLDDQIEKDTSVFRKDTVNVVDIKYCLYGEMYVQSNVYSIRYLSEIFEQSKSLHYRSTYVLLRTSRSRYLLSAVPEIQILKSRFCKIKSLETLKENLHVTIATRVDFRYRGISFADHSRLHDLHADVGSTLTNRSFGSGRVKIHIPRVKEFDIVILLKMLLTRGGFATYIKSRFYSWKSRFTIRHLICPSVVSRLTTQFDYGIGFSTRWSLTSLREKYRSEMTRERRVYPWFLYLSPSSSVGSVGLNSEYL